MPTGEQVERRGGLRAHAVRGGVCPGMLVALFARLLAREGGGS